MENSPQKGKKLALLLIATFFGSLVLFSGVHAQETAAPAPADGDVTKLNEEIRQRRQRILDLEAQKKSYEEKVDEKADAVASAEGQLSLIENQIAITNLTIASTEEKIEALRLDIEKATVEIADREEEIRRQKEHMGDLIRQLYRYNERTLLEVTLAYDRLSGFFEEMNTLSTIETELHGEVDRLGVLKHEMEIRREDLEGTRSELDAEKVGLERQRGDLNDQQSFQAVLVTDLTQEKLQVEDVLDELQREERQVSGEITTLEDEFRRKLQSSPILPDLGDAAFIWPVAPLRGISAYFHDPKYPFRSVFEHPAVDIPTPQGTSIMAAEDGIVVIARKRDWITNANGRIVSPAYNYVSIVHDESLSTVYGHLSSIVVSEETFVRKGTVIGLSGGTPGTAGAGRLTTGPHVHFEVRVNGIPDDPLKYLPAQ